MRRLGVTLTLFAAAAMVAVPTVAYGAVAAPGGADVSYPQCDSSTSSSASDLPTGAAYGIVGVNKGIATKANPCFTAEYQWAVANGGTSEHPTPEVYVNTADPGAALASWWPTSNVTQNGTVVTGVPGGTCKHTTSEPCAYVYGYSIAEKYDQQADHTKVWLDVETTNTWQKSTTDNRADLAGMIAYFTSQKNDTVGLYSGSAQWKTIIGSVASTSSLAKLDTWIAGISSSAAAKTCESTGLTSGSRIALVQSVVSGVDRDLSCHLMNATAPSVSGLASPHKTLSIAGTSWIPSGAYVTYQWRRNGTPISGATHSTYVTSTTDKGHHISVQVSARLSGWTNTTILSTSLEIS